MRPQEPPHIAPRAASTLKDPRAGNASFHRYYVAPSYVTAKPGEAEALDLLMKIAADGATSRLYRKLVVEDKVAATPAATTRAAASTAARIALYAVPTDGVDLDEVEAADRRRARTTSARTASPQLELERAKKALHRRLHLRERQPGVARPPLRLGARHRPLGRPTSKAGRRRIAKVTADDIKKAADKLSRLAPLGDRLADARAGRRRRAADASSTPGTQRGRDA